MTVRVRLAPSPTGTLHIGTARTALFNWLYAKREGGKFLIRIEDTDKERSKIEYTQNIFEGLSWLGLSWDETPVIQSERINEHKKAIKSLLESGLAYRCFATEEELDSMRKTQKEKGQAPRYDNRYRNTSPEEEKKYIQEGRTSVIRFRINDNQVILWEDLIRGNMKWRGQDLGGDMVISRRASNLDIGDPLYNLVVVVDDAGMNITHVIRGEDHLSNTAKQILLYEALGLTTPKFAHTPLILNNEGKKLSKRDGVTSINDFREMGYTAKATSNYMTLLGWSVPEGMEERFTLEEASKVFSLDRVNKAGAKFDWDKINWLNSQVIKDYSPECLWGIFKPMWIKEGWEEPTQEIGISISKLLSSSITLLKDCVKEAKPFFLEPELEDDAIKQLNIEGAKNCLKVILEKLEDSNKEMFDSQSAKTVINNISKEEGIKKGLIMKTLRAALMGRMQGPDLISSWVILSRSGKDRIRIKRCI